MPVYETASRKALLVALGVLGALVVLAIASKPPPAPPVDRTRAPQWIKSVSYTHLRAHET